MTVIDKATERQEQTGLRCLHSGPVEESQIDQLGHMNVRFYGFRATCATEELATQLGLPPLGKAEAGARLALTDLYSRHYREQLLGAPLEVWGGVLDVEDTRLRFYHELYNPELDQIACTFVHTLQLQNPQTQEPIPFSPDIIENATQAIAPWPEYGRPRSIDLDGPVVSPSLTEARSRGLEMRKVRVIQENECDAEGVFQADHFVEILWGGERLDEVEHSNWLNELKDGRKFGFATMESRGALNRLPRAGDRVQSFGADVEMGRKTLHGRFWVYDLDTEELLCTMSEVSVAFDIAARKAIEIPEEKRVEIQKTFHPDLL